MVQHASVTTAEIVRESIEQQRDCPKVCAVAHVSLLLFVRECQMIIES